MVSFTHLDVEEKLEDKVNDHNLDSKSNLVVDNYQDSGVSSMIGYEMYSRELDAKERKKYKDVDKPIVEVVPLMPVERRQMEPGLYGFAVIGKYIAVKDGVYNPREINDHEQLHQNAPSLSEYLVRVIIRWRHDKTYHQ